VNAQDGGSPLLTLLREASQRGWMQAYRSELPGVYSDYRGQARPAGAVPGIWWIAGRVAVVAGWAVAGGGCGRGLRECLRGTAPLWRRGAPGVGGRVSRRSG